MPELIAALSGFGLASVAPALHRVFGRWTGWVLALLPAALTAYFIARIPEISDGEVFESSYEWVPALGIDLAFRLDGLSLLFGLMICGIGTLIVIYAGGYLTGHPQLGRFYAYLLMFMGSMLGLVLADNIFSLFVFWELTSVSSYLLIGFNHDDEVSRKSAWQALLVTGMGGVAMLAGLVLMGQVTGAQQISQITQLGDTVRADGLYVPILLLMLAGAFTKSAQVPFHFWLPNAMAAPTPVSAYLHSATMVKAGVYLLARFHPALSGTDEWLYIVTAVGAVTMVTGAFVATRETDLKRILAYSTLSVLGLLTMLLGEGSVFAIKAAVVFMLAHALYKGALFLVAGSIDHETGTREIGSLGGLRKTMPITAIAGILGAISLAGLAPMFSFIGKEFVLEAVLGAERGGIALVIATVAAAAMLVAVAGLVGVRPFLGAERDTPKTPHEAPPSMWLGAVLLAMLGVIMGLLPGSLTEKVVSPAVTPVFGAPETISVSLWHGLNTELLLSGVSIALGIGVYLSLPYLRRLDAPLASLAIISAERWYDRLMGGMMSLASWQTRVMQDGFLRHYILIIIGTGVTLAGVTLISRGTIGDLPTLSGTRPQEVVVAALILLGALAVVFATSRLAAVASLGVVGYGIALLYLMFGAPDLAMTQVLIETLTVILFVLAFYHLPQLSTLSRVASRARDAVVAIAAGALMTGLILVAVSSPVHEPISTYFVERARPEAEGGNIVNVILVDFRALDTLGEIIVLAIAGAGVYALLKLRPHRTEDEE